MSQALFPDVGTPSHIVAMTKHNGPGPTDTTNTTSGTPPLGKTTSHKSGGIGTGAIAGIAAAIIILTLSIGGFAFWRFYWKNRHQNKTDSTAELDSKNAQDTKQRPSSDSSLGGTKKEVASDVKEVSSPMTPPTMPEMPASFPFFEPPELPDSSYRSELESGFVSSPELAAEEIRSELSTPEPSELASSGLPSPDLPDPFGAASSSSTTGLWRHSRRQDSSDGETVSTPTTLGHNDRKGSDESALSVPTPLIPRHHSLKHSDGPFRPPLHRRKESSSSVETIGSRLVGGSHPSPFSSPALHAIRDTGRGSPSLESDGGRYGLVVSGPVHSRFQERLDPPEGIVEVAVKEIEKRESQAAK